MKLAQTITLVILVLMSLAAGVAKVMQMEQEVQFFQQAGLNASWLMGLGVMQIIGAGLAVIAKFRSIGAGLMGAGFLISAIVIFMTGNAGFGAFSLVPVLLAGFLMAGSRAS